MPNLFRTIFDSIIRRKGNNEMAGISEMSPSPATPVGEMTTPSLTYTEPDTMYEIPRVFDILNGQWTSLRLTDARICGYGVFSNVYYGRLIEPEEMEVAIKKVWPKKSKRNDEMLLLATFRKLGARNVAQLLYTGRSTHGEGTRNALVCETFYMTYQDLNLDQLIRSKGTLDLVETKLYAWQLFNGLDFLAMNKIMHRDVKPVNILVNRATGELQIADFGSAKLVKNTEELSTGYQVTRYYRPPELLYSKGMMVYDWRVDLWSAGCVVAEMISGKVLFASRNVKHQRTRTQYALGVPSEKEIQAMGIPEEVVVDSIDLSIRSIGIKKFLRDYSIPSEAIRFLSKLFVYNPKKRPHGEKAMTDPFFNEIYSLSTHTSTGLATAHLLQRQKGPAMRPYDFEGMFTVNRRTDTPIIPTPAVSSHSDGTYSDTQVMVVSPLFNLTLNSQEDDRTPVGIIQMNCQYEGVILFLFATESEGTSSSRYFVSTLTLPILSFSADSLSCKTAMGNKNKQKRQSSKNNNNNNHHNKSGSRKHSDVPPSPFEISAESSPSTSEEEFPSRALLAKLFPWRETSNLKQRQEEVQLRIAASSLLAYPNVSSLLPMIKKIAVHRDRVDGSIPILPPVLVGALTQLFTNRAHSSTTSFPFADLPSTLQQRIGDLANAIPELRLTSRETLNAVTEDTGASTSDVDACLHELSILAKRRHLFLDRAKIRKNSLFTANWFRPGHDGFSAVQLQCITGPTTMDIESVDMDYYFTRRADSDMLKRAELRWWTRLNEKGIPLWVYDMIRPQFTFRFKANYEEGDVIDIRIGLVTRTRKEFFLPPIFPTKTHLGHNLVQYEVIVSDLPPPVLPFTTHAGPLDLSLHLIIPPLREDIVIFDFDVRFSIPGKDEIADRVAEYDMRQMRVKKAEREFVEMTDSEVIDAKVKMMFPSTQYDRNFKSSFDVFHKISPPTPLTTDDKKVSSQSKIQIPQGKSAARNVAGRRK